MSSSVRVRARSINAAAAKLTKCMPWTETLTMHRLRARVRVMPRVLARLNFSSHVSNTALWTEGVVAIAQGK
jgi:hypothetical protein